jgi:hypothetical protein
MGTRLACLFSALLVVSGCTNIETKSEAISSQNLSLATPPITESVSPLKPVSPKLFFNAKQRKYLDATLPADVRKILEDSETFEILAEVGPKEATERDLTEFRPNRIVAISDERQKRQILESFYSDAATQDGPANCYEPHHGIRAGIGDKSIEIEICFACAQFKGVGDLRSVSGTIVRSGRKSENLFGDIVERQSVELIK